MKPESRRALMELISLGMEEISSEQAAPLLARISECSECEGQWVLIHRTIDTLSNVGETDISNQRSQQMWLVCLEHAHHKDADGNPLKEGHLISETHISTDDEQDAHAHHASANNGFDRIRKHIEGLRAPMAFLAPQLGFVVAGGAMLVLLHA